MSHTLAGWRDALCGNAGQNSPAPADSTSEGKGQHTRKLTPARALEIFMLRPQLKTLGQLRRGSMVHCKTIAPQFGVSPKTVREIWAGRAWARATRKEWTKEEIATGAVSSFSRMIRADSAGGASNPSDTSHPGALGPPRQDHTPMQHAAPLPGPTTRPLQTLLAAPQQASSGLPAAQPAWGSGAATSVPDLESAIRSLAKLTQLQAQPCGLPAQFLGLTSTSVGVTLLQHQAQQHDQRPQQHLPGSLTSTFLAEHQKRDQRQSLQLEVHHFLEQKMLFWSQQQHATEKAVAMGRLPGQQSLVVGLPLSPSGRLSSNHHEWWPS